MDTIDKSLWRELKATTQEEFEANKVALKAIVKAETPKISGIKTLDEFYQFLVEFTQINPFDRPIQFYKTNHTSEPDHVTLLEQWGFPADFVHWHKKYGHAYLALFGFNILPTSLVVQYVQSDQHKLLTANGYLLFTMDVGGNPYVFNMKTTPPEIRFVDHDTAYTGIDLLDELYSEHYHFWYHRDTNELNNPGNLDPALVKNSDGQYNLSSVYIKDYLAEALEPVHQTTLLELFIAQTEAAMRGILKRYRIAFV